MAAEYRLGAPSRFPTVAVKHGIRRLGKIREFDAPYGLQLPER